MSTDPQVQPSSSNDKMSVAAAQYPALSSHQNHVRGTVVPEPQARQAVQAPALSIGAPLIRAFDVVAAVVVLAASAPMLLLIALAIKLFDPGPVLVIHQKIGQGGTVFGCLKFRSMSVDADQRLRRLLESNADARAQWARYRRLRRDPRVTALGSFLRRSSLDGLPRFFNVLRGEMSLIGPRPISPAEAGRVERSFDVYFGRKPGFTGLGQAQRRVQASDRCQTAPDLA